MLKLSDAELGMCASITRRDFLNGTAFAVGGLLAAGGASPAIAAENYPPALTGLRGHHAGSFEGMHKLMRASRDGEIFEAGQVTQTGETYDLVVIGAGISGLAAAYLYRQQNGPASKILLLDNHDDFGGHAKRNEFTSSSGKKLIGYGGSQSLQTPSYFSPAVNTLLASLGVDVAKFNGYYDAKWYENRGLGDGFFFAKEVFGEDKMVVKTEKASEWVPNTPLNEKAKADLIKLLDDETDFFVGLSRDDKVAMMAKLTYREFLKDHVKADQQVIDYFAFTTTEYFGVGIDAVSCADAWAIGNPGFGAMDLGEKALKSMSPSGRLVQTDPDEYIFHFPDGNASIARLLVRSLVPGSMPGTTMEDIVTAVCDYSKLDRTDAAVRLRLNATALQVKHQGPIADAKAVDVIYSVGGQNFQVTANHAIFACFHQVIPYIAPELDLAQRTALVDQQKIPLVYTNVLIRNWQAFAKLGINGFESPGHYWDKAVMDFPVSMGEYKFADKPDEPMILHLGKVPANPASGSLREQAIAGRKWLLKEKFEDMEREVRSLLTRALGPAGFDAARDIEAITINRWSHGYSYEYMRPWDAYWPDGPLPIETARKGWGRIAIANADAGAYAYAHSSIDQATRAVRELLGTPADAPEFGKFPGPPLDLLEL